MIKNNMLICMILNNFISFLCYQVALRLHVRANALLEGAHFISQREFTCSLTDCLRLYD